MPVAHTPTDSPDLTMNSSGQEDSVIKGGPASDAAELARGSDDHQWWGFFFFL